MRAGIWFITRASLRTASFLDLLCVFALRTIAGFAHRRAFCCRPLLLSSRTYRSTGFAVPLACRFAHASALSPWFCWVSARLLALRVCARIHLDHHGFTALSLSRSSHRFARLTRGLLRLHSFCLCHIFRLRFACRSLVCALSAFRTFLSVSCVSLSFCRFTIASPRSDTAESFTAHFLADSFAPRFAPRFLSRVFFCASFAFSCTRLSASFRILVCISFCTRFRCLSSRFSFAHRSTFSHCRYLAFAPRTLAHIFSFATSFCASRVLSRIFS